MVFDVGILSRNLSIILTIGFTAASCSSGSGDASSSEAAASSLNASNLVSKDLVNAMTGDFASHGAALAQLESMPLARVFDAILANASDESVTIDGVTIAGTKTFMGKIRGQYLASMSAYPTLGDYLHGEGIDPASITEAELAASVKNLPSLINAPANALRASSLELAADVNIVGPPPQEDKSQTAYAPAGTQTQTITGVTAPLKACKAFDGLMTTGYAGVTAAGLASLDHAIAKVSKYAAIGLGALGGLNYGLSYLFCHQYPKSGSTVAAQPGD